jgi:hypothetical protein
MNRASELRRRRDGAPMLKNTPALSKPFELQRRVIKYLAEHPGCRILEIQRGVEANYHSAVSRAIRGLSKEGLVEEAPQKNQWVLTIKGFNMALSSSVENPLAIKRYVVAYSGIYPRIRELLDLIERVELVAGDRAENILRTTIKFMVALSTLNVSREEEAAMVISLLTILLGHEGVLRFTALGETSRISP